MTNNKQQTAVEWYISKIKEARNFCDDPTMEMDIRHTLEVLIKKGEQAKEMEKQQIRNAYNDGHTDGAIDRPGLTSGTIYYMETFGGGEQ
jgi:predicted secreted protein